MSSLQELAVQCEEIINLLYDEELDEQTVLDTYEALEMEFEDKAEAYAYVLQRIKGEMSFLEEQEKYCKQRRDVLKNRSVRVKRHLEEAMRLTGKTKFKTPLYSFGIQKNGGKQPLIIDVNVNELPDEYKIIQDPLPDTEGIRALLKRDGVESCDIAHLEPRGEHLRISGVKS
jgi:Siphovirus Gp157.